MITIKIRKNPKAGGNNTEYQENSVTNSITIYFLGKSENWPSQKTYFKETT
ncbi:hypothetical protein [Photorhabdus bodei]|uniref:Transposase n=1 Tax=Photorhabdus bodei TaxID=2029681 RepID=A0ABX0AIE2_9GAMM|nr:hypothetical protein [Photorhabdus bodei]NDK98516.1 hypothetical protein [Photorhabdus bodei]NDL02768.1 hypothetical protein [Photorhabdus bodei]NDL06973.1 hypothetical protein [Photorhabdus bodei]